MAERHHIDSDEFDQWVSELYPDTIMGNSRETLYDLWVEGYSSWEVEGILSM